MSLKSFHLVFILLAIIGADLFGGWALRDYHESGDTLMLSLGIVSLLGGLGLAVYSFFLVRKLEREHLA